MLVSQKSCFGLLVFGISPVFEYLDYVTDIPGFEPKLASRGDGGYMRSGVLSALTRYVRDNPGTKKCGKSEEEMLDAWIEQKMKNA